MKIGVKKLVALFMSLMMVASLCAVNVFAGVKKSVALDETAVTMTIGGTKTLNATVTGAKTYKLLWSSSNKSVVAVSNGKLTAKKAGNADITVKLKGTSAKAVCKVTVKDASSETAFDFVKNIKIGWNLGNTLDSLGSGVESETCWGNIKTTEAMIKAVKAEGFNAVRIPTSWGKHMNSSNVIDEKWLDRVQEVVDYAIDNDMYVILNAHHENDWLMPKGGSTDASQNKLKALWKQVSTRFKDYDEHLIFEGMNEPRTEGSANEWNGGTKAERAAINKYIDIFVSAVRSTGGNNGTRYLMVPTYAASANYSAINELVLPDDDRIIVDIHSYSPYNMALNRNSAQKTLDSNGKKEVDYLMSTINNSLIKKGQAVIIGEFGSMNKENTDERVKLATYYVSKAKEIGVPCFWWDNGTKCPPTQGEGFGIFDRTTLKWWYKEIADAAVKAAADK